MHSFQARYIESAFVIKADLFKAFNTLSWSYLQRVLEEFHFSPQLSKLIMSCVTGSKFSIKLNGVAGRGFITPERGLRQGCPLSPYLFILSMEILSQFLNGLQRTGDIRGITLAQQGPVITHSMYADDLVLFGTATGDEARKLAEAMDTFGNLSELKINNEKSIIWCSNSYQSRT